MESQKQVPDLVVLETTQAWRRPSANLAGRFIRLALGILLLGAALLKGHALSTGPLVGEGIWANRWMMALMVEAEGALGLWLLSGLLPALALRFAAACFVLYAGFALHKALSGASSCGCFGRVAVNPWLTLTLDLIAAPAALWAGWGGEARRERITWKRGVGWATVFLTFGIPAYLKMTTYHAAPQADLKLVVLDSRNWIGQSWPLGCYVEGWEALSRGRWAVLLYNWPCGHCAETVRAYAELSAEWEARGAAERVALIEAGDPPPESVKTLLHGSPALQVRLNAPAEWFINSPTVVVLNEGRVVAVAEGEEDCIWNSERLGQW